MAFVLNTSGKPIYTQLCDYSQKGKVTISKRFTFLPAALTEVSGSDWDELKKHPFIQECMDDEILESGSRAKKKGAKAEKEVESVDKEALEKGKDK